jgi:hypothetical protein
VKREIPPWVAVAIVVVVALVAGFMIYTRSGPGAHAKEAEDAIQSSVMGAGGKPVTAGPPGMAVTGQPGTGDPAQAGLVRPGAAPPSGGQPGK